MSQSHRQNLADDFAKTLATDFAEHGKAAIATLRETKLDTYLRLVAAIDPPADPNKTSPLETLSDEHLNTALAMVRAAIAEKSSPSPSPLEGEGQPQISANKTLSSRALVEPNSEGVGLRDLRPGTQECRPQRPSPLGPG